MPKPKSNQAVEEDEIQNLNPIEEYEAEFHESPNVPSYNKGVDIYYKVRDNEPDFRITATGITGRLGEIIGSRQFRNALAGFEIPEEASHDQEGNVIKTQLSPEQDQRRSQADLMIAKLKTCLYGLEYAYGGDGKRVHGFRMLFQLSNLLKEKVGADKTVYSMLRDTARQLPKDQPGRVGSKSARGENAQEMTGLNLLIKEEPELKMAESMLPDLYTDLYYLDTAVGLGLDLPNLDPDSVVREPNLSLVETWDDYYEAQCRNLPYEPAARKDRLAKVLVGAFEAGRVSDAGPNQKAPLDPYSPKLAKNYAKQLRESPIFRRLCKDPQRVKDLLTKDPKRPNKQFNAMMHMFRPFGNVKAEKGQAVLANLKNMLPVMDPPRGRSKEWKALYESIENIDLLDLPADPEKKLQEIYDKTCAYMKGKKSLRKNQELQNRFDQCLDVLSVLAGSGPYGKLAAETVIDRVNEVRIGHNSSYKKIYLDDFGREAIYRHNNHPEIAHGLDKLPRNQKLLPAFPKKNPNNQDQAKSFTPLAEYTEYVAPLYRDGDVSVFDIQTAIAAALVLNKKQVYYYHGSTNDPQKDMKLKKYGRAVLDGRNFDSEIMTLANSPAVRNLAQKYINDPNARMALRNELAPQELEPLPQLIRPLPEQEFELQSPVKAPKKVGFIVPEDEKQPPKKKVGFNIQEEEKEPPKKAPKKKVGFDLPEEGPKKAKVKKEVRFGDKVELYTFQKIKKKYEYDPVKDAQEAEPEKGARHELLKNANRYREARKEQYQRQAPVFDPGKLNVTKLMEDYNAAKREVEAQKANAGPVKT